MQEDTQVLIDAQVAQLMGLWGNEMSLRSRQKIPQPSSAWFWKAQASWREHDGEQAYRRAGEARQGGSAQLLRARGNSVT